MLRSPDIGRGRRCHQHAHWRYFGVWRTRCILERRSGKLRVRKTTSARVGMGLAQEYDFSTTLTQKNFAKTLKFLTTTPKMRTSRKGPSYEETEMRHYKLGE